MDSKKILVRLKNVSKSFNGKMIFTNVNLEIKEGDVIGIVGESGIGKSTLLRIIDKEIEPDENSNIKRNGIESLLIPQHPALWDNMNVLQNVSIVRQLLHNENNKIANRKAQDLLLKLKVKEESYARFPNTLSGGEKQRVSIARGLASEKKLLLFDEVTSSIDPDNKSIVTSLINDLSNKGYTIVFVTHDLFSLSMLDCLTIKLEKDCLKNLENNGKWNNT